MSKCKSAEEFLAQLDALTIGRVGDPTQGKTHDYYRHRDIIALVRRAQLDAINATLQRAWEVVADLNVETMKRTDPKARDWAAGVRLAIDAITGLVNHPETLLGAT